jgi:hypothetical protein
MCYRYLCNSIEMNLHSLFYVPILLAILSHLINRQNALPYLEYVCVGMDG